MSFKTPKDVLDTISAGDKTNQIRSDNRAKVTRLLNGSQLVTDAEADANHQEIRSNFGEAPVLFAHARRQMESAFLKPSKYFRVDLPSAPREHQIEWAAGITEEINEIMKDSLAFMELIRSEAAAVIAHGPAPSMWLDSDSWKPTFIAIDDLRIPMDTTLDMESMPWFAVRRALTVGELVKKVYGEHAEPYWNKKIIAKILDQYKELNVDDTNPTWETSPEKMEAALKQNGGYWSSDKAPTVTLWNFYFKNDDDKWTLRIIADADGVKGAAPTEFLYDRGNDTVADKLSQLLHVQYGDLNVNAPFLYHEVRSLGYLLYEPCFWANQVRCRLIQHCFEQMNQLFRVTNPAGKARAAAINIFDKSIIPEGVSIVPANERHQIDLRLIESVQAQLRQLMNEASTQYNQNLDTGTQKEQTAYEVAAKLNMVNAMMSNILIVAFQRKNFAYQEIARRFCISPSTDKDVKKFQKRCSGRGIPKEWLDFEKWRVEIEIPMGSGNPTMASAQANWLFQNRAAYSPQAQQEILNFVTSVMTDDARKGARLAPLDGKSETTPSQKFAESDFGLLMRGHEVAFVDSANVIEQTTVMLKLLGEEVQMAMQDGKATARDVWGMHMVEKHVGMLIQQMAQDPARQELAKSASDALGKLSNEIRKIEQYVTKQAQEQAAAQQDGARMESEAKTAAIVGQAQAKVQTHREQTAAKMQMQAEQAQVKNAIKMESHQMDQQRANDAMLAEQARLNAVTEADVSRKNVLAQAQVEQAKKTKAETNTE